MDNREIKEGKKYSINRLLPYGIAILLLALPFFWFKSGQVIAGGEVYMLLNPKLAFQKGLLAWNSVTMGMPNIYIVSLGYHFLSYVLNIFFSLATLQKIILGLFLSLSFLSCHNLLSFLFKQNNKFYLSVGALLYVFNPFFAVVFPWLPTYGFIFVLAPLILKYLMEFLEAKSGDKVILAKLFVALFLFNTVALNVALFGILFFIAFLYLVYYIILNRPSAKSFSVKIAWLILAIALASACWFWPFLKIYKSLYGGAVVHQTNFQEKSIYKLPILNAMTLNEYFWFDKKNMDGTLIYKYSAYYQLPSQIILLSLIALVAYFLSFSRKQGEDRKKVYFFVFLFIIGVFLTKGTAQPFGWLYKTCLASTRFCGIYRASDIKFPYLVVLSLAVLVAYLVKSLENLENKKIADVSASVVMGVIIFLGMPFIFGDIFNKSIFVTVPGYWNALRNKIESDQISERILLLPKNFSPFDNYSWGYEGSWLGDQIADVSVLGYTFGYGSSLQEKRLSVITKLYDSLETRDIKSFKENLGLFNIRYILMRKDFDLNKSSTSGLAYDKNISFYSEKNLQPILDKNFTKVFSEGELSLYKIPDAYYVPRFYISKNGNGRISAIEKINATKYRVKIASVKNYTPIIFSEAFDGDWKVYLTGKSYSENKSSFDRYFYETWFKKPVIDEDKHLMVNGYANSWNLNVEEICLDNAKCVKNADGTYDLELVIEFWPQRLFYAGLFVSGSTLFSCLIYLGYDLVKKRKNN